MKNLKKILSLSLAVIMLMGMFVIAPASAADATGYAALADKDEIENIDAVALLVDLGIIEGKPGTDGNVFDPTGAVDRATMAKFVTMLSLKNADPSAFENTNTGLTDIDNSWAKGYIAYSFSQGIIAGDGLGNFNPTKQVSLVEAAKMLLVALGYDADKEGLVGADWALNTIALGTKANLFTGIGLAATDVLDRDTAALLIYNTLFANQVEYSAFTNGAIIRENTLGLATFGLVAIVGEVQTAGSKDLTLKVNNTNPADAHANWAKGKTVNLALGGQQAYVGKNVTIFVTVPTKTETKNFVTSVVVANTANPTVVSSEVTLNSDTVLGTNVKGTKLSDLSTSSKSDYIADLDDDGVTYYLNGKKLADIENKETARVQIQAALGATVVNYAVTEDKGSTGAVIVFMDNDGDGKADAIDVTIYAAVKVTSKTTSGDGRLTFNATPFKKNDGTAFTATSKNTPAFDDISKDDIVYGYVDGDDNLQLVIADYVEGRVSGKTSSKFKLDGKEYTWSGKAINGNDDVNSGKDFKVYTDGNGYVIFAEQVSEDSKDVAYVIGADGATMAGQTTKLLFTDGTISTIIVEKVDSKSTEEVGFTALATGDVVTYSVNDDNKYEVNKVASTPFSGEIKNKATTLGGKTINAKTVFVIQADNDTYTGYNDVPDMSDVVAAIYSKNGTVAEYVFVTKGSASAKAEDKFVIYDKTAWELIDNDGKPYYEYKAVVDGELTTVNVTVALHDTTGDSDIQGYNLGLYTATTKTTLNGVSVISGISGAPTAFVTNTVVTAIGDGIVSNGVKAYIVDEDTVFIVLEADGAKYKASIGGEGNIVNNDAQKTNIQIIAAGDSGEKADIARYVFVFDTVEVTP